MSWSSLFSRGEIKRGEDILKEVKKFCYLGDMIIIMVEHLRRVSSTIGSACKNFRELSVMLVGKQGSSLKQRGEIYQCCVRPVLLYCCETWELTVADEARLRGMEHCIIRMMCEVRLVDRVSTDILCDRVDVIVKIEDMITQSRLGWSCVETSVHKYVRLWK